MHIFKIYDNGGETFDRFTILVEALSNGNYEALGLSSDPDWTLGFSQFGEAVDGEHLGREIVFDQLPANVQRHVLTRLGY